MKKPSAHPINSRILSTFTDIDLELQLDKHRNYLFDLSYLSLLDIDGAKSSDFLQGQLTCDLRQVNDIRMMQGAQCNLKGRILALVDVMQWHGFKLIIPEDLLVTTQNSLAKTAQLSRVSLQKNNELQLFGFYLQNPQDLLAANLFFPKDLHAQAYTAEFAYYHLGNGFYIFAVKKDYVEQFCQPFIDSNQLLGSLTWHTLRLAQGQIEIYPESRGLFLPHRLDLQKTSYLSFDKGCYKGQEIIARTHYKATLKHELRIFKIQTTAPIYSGQKLFKIDAEMEVGELVDYSALGAGNYLIAVSLLNEVELLVRFADHTDNTILHPIGAL